MSIKVNPCRNIINFDGVDFSERRSEEVMFLLRLSVIRDSKLAFSNMKVWQEPRLYSMCIFLIDVALVSGAWLLSPP